MDLGRNGVVAGNSAYGRVTSDLRSHRIVETDRALAQRLSQGRSDC
jgi:hypothetical protein